MLVLRLTNFFTKDFIAFYNSILYQNIVRVDNQGSKLIVYGKTPKETVALAQTKEIPVVFMLAELQRKNPDIIVRYFVKDKQNI